MLKKSKEHCNTCQDEFNSSWIAFLCQAIHIAYHDVSLLRISYLGFVVHSSLHRGHVIALVPGRVEPANKVLITGVIPLVCSVLRELC